MRVFKLIDQMSNVRRWSHAYCHKPESILEHTAVVSIIALALAAKLGADVEKVLERALLHDMEETVTGDIPTPTKYHNPAITEEIKRFEAIAAKEVCYSYFGEWAWKVWREAKDDSLEGEIIRVADAGAVVLKIQQEKALGNRSFEEFEENIWNALLNIKQNITNECLIPHIHELMDITLGANDEHS